MFLLAQPTLELNREKPHLQRIQNQNVRELVNMPKFIQTVQQINKLTSSLPTTSPLFEDKLHEESSCDVGQHQVYHYLLDLVKRDIDQSHDSFTEITMQRLVQQCTEKDETDVTTRRFLNIQATYKSLQLQYYDILCKNFPQYPTTLATFAIERFMIEDYLYEHIFLDSAQDSVYDDNLSEKLNLFASAIEPKQLDIQLDVKNVHWKSAVKTFRTINLSRSISGKLESLAEAMKHLFDIPAFNSMGGDTFLSLTIYLVMYANIRDLHSNIKFLTNYSEIFYETEMNGQWGYFLTNLSIAVSWWKNVNLCSKPLSEYFMAVTPQQVEDIVCKWNCVYGTKLIPDADFVIVEDHFAPQAAPNDEQKKKCSDQTVKIYKMNKRLMHKRQNSSDFFSLDPDANSAKSLGSIADQEDLVHRWQPRPITAKRANGFVANCVVSWDYVSKISEEDNSATGERRLSVSSCPELNYVYSERRSKPRRSSFKKIGPMFANAVNWLHRRPSVNTAGTFNLPENRKAASSPLSSPRLATLLKSPEPSIMQTIPETPPSSSYENIIMKEFEASSLRTT